MGDNFPVIVLVSGGMDSVTALRLAARDHRVRLGLSVDYGAKHTARELPCAARQCARLGIRHQVITLDLNALGFRSALLQSGAPIPDGHYEDAAMRQTVVPFRNGLFLALAGGLAESLGAAAVVLGAHAGDHAIYPDCRPAFLDAFDQALRLGTYAGLRILRPFEGWTKARIVAAGAGLGVDYADTWSCYKGGDLHCGACGTCIERREAFRDAGVPDPTIYAATPPLPDRP